MVVTYISYWDVTFSPFSYLCQAMQERTITNVLDTRSSNGARMTLWSVTECVR